MNKENEPKIVTIIVNGRPKDVTKNDAMTYEEVVALAFENPPMGDSIQYTVQYTRGDRDKPSGSITIGQTVKIKKGMVFDVTQTNRS